MLNGLDLFSGIGGLAIALEPWVKPVAYCENDRYAQAVLLSRMADYDIPRAPIWDDITSLNGSMLPSIDIVYGGFPCQDISCAGIGAGLEGKRSGLFFEILRLAREIRPTFLFLENVPAIRTRGLGTIIHSLAEIGYDCRWEMLSASEIGAPHKRERWFLLANAVCKGLPISGGKQKKAVNRRGRTTAKCGLQGSVWNEIAAELCRIPDGIRPATHRIRGLGNAVVPLQAKTAFEYLMGMKTNH